MGLEYAAEVLEGIPSGLRYRGLASRSPYDRRVVHCGVQMPIPHRAESVLRPLWSEESFRVSACIGPLVRGHLIGKISLVGRSCPDFRERLALVV